MAEPIVLVEDLVYEYPTKRALHSVSCQIEHGSITALVGPNGAGKTTFLRCLAALDNPFSGQITINGLKTQNHPRDVHRQIGYLSDLFGIYDELTVQRCLYHAAAIHQIPAAQIPDHVAKSAERLGLETRLQETAGTLSRGLRQRLAIAQTIIHDPVLLLLDEPASGLDPEARQSLSELMLSLRDDGMTLLVSSHILAELEDYSSHMLIIDNGHIIEHSMLHTSTSGAQDYDTSPEAVPLRICLACPDERLHQVLSAIPGIEAVEGDFQEVTVLFQGEVGQRHEIIRHLVESCVPVIAFQEQKASLQEAYLQKLKVSRRTVAAHPGGQG